jgi:hypothetical protein
MDSSNIAGTALLMSQASSREGVSLSMIKQAADTQKQMANMIASVASQQPDSRYNFSVYA